MTFYLFSIGCKVNAYECEAIKSLLLKECYLEDKNNPDVIIINTCSVTATADQKSRQHIRKFMSNFPRSVVAVMGCYSQGHYDFIRDDIKAHIIIGTSYRNEIPSLIKEYLLNKKQIVKVDDNTRTYKYEELGVTSFSDNARSYLKIQDGCDNFCSYCLIPYRRGKMRSRDPKYVLEEANNLVRCGYQEIVLTGIHVGGYGKDLEDISFSSLVEKLLNIQGLNRLRISSIEESEIDDKLIDLLKTKNNLAKHLHIPLQSGSETVLKRMNRKYNKENFLNKIKSIRLAYPEVCITTDVIVGFPGESDEEFAETYNFIKECEFDMLHVFPFSSREGTLASRMKDQIDPRIKKERVNKLLELSNTLWKKYCDKFIDREVEVLVEKYDDINHLSSGHTSNYLEVCFNSTENNVGKIVNTIYKNHDTIKEN